MNAMILLLASATVGVDVGWQPLAGGGFEYIIQIEPETLESLKAGNDIISEIPPELVGVRRYRITVGTGPVPRIGTPPEVASGQFRPADQSAASQGITSQGTATQGATSQGAATQGDMALDPFATSRNVGQPDATNPDTANPNAAQPDPFAPSSTPPDTDNNSTQPADNAAGQTNDRYATAGADPFASSRNGAGTPAGTAGDSSQAGSPANAGTAGSLLDSVRSRLRESGDTAAPADSLGNPNANNATDTATTGDTTSPGNAVPQMGENPFRGQDRYASNPDYGADGSRYSAGTGTLDPFSPGGGADLTAPSQELGPTDLPPGEYITPLPPTTDFSQPSSTTNDRYGDRYGDFYNSGDSGTSTTGANNATQPQTHEETKPSPASDPFDRSRFYNNSNSSNSNDTPPPALNPDDNATRLANYRTDEAGPSGSSKKNASKDTAEEAQPGWMWTILVLAMFASAGANGWLAMLLRDSRRKYADLLERYQHGEDEEYSDEEGVHYEAA